MAEDLQLPPLGNYLIQSLGYGARFDKIREIFEKSKTPFIDLQNLGTAKDDIAYERTVQLRQMLDWSATIAGRKASQKTASEVAQISRSTAAEILDSYARLKAILEVHEATIRQRWSKKPENQRKAFLLRAWPGMAAKHRPDFECLFKRWNIAQPEDEEAYLWPFINLEDLACGRNMILFLNSRGRNHPSIFTHMDWQASRLGWIMRKIIPVKLGGYKMLLNGDDCETYGRLVEDSSAKKNSPSSSRKSDESDGEDSDQDPDMFDPGHGLLVLKSQARTLRFLVQVVKLLLHDRDLTLQQEPRPEPAEFVQKSTEWPSVMTMNSEAPYRVPTLLDLRRVLERVLAKEEEAEDHITSLREDPVYFYKVVGDYHSHREESLPGPDGMPHPTYETEEYWNKLLLQVLRHSYESVVLWKTIRETLFRLISLEEEYSKDTLSRNRNPSEEYRSIKMTLQSLLLAGSMAYRQHLREIHKASPPLRHLFVRKDTGKDNHSNVVIKTPSKDRLVFLILEICQWQLLALLQMPTFVDEIQHMLKDSKESQKISGLVAKAISNQGFVCQLRTQLKFYKPIGNMEKPSYARSSIAATRDIMGRMMITLKDVDLGWKHLRVAKLVQPLTRFNVSSNNWTVETTSPVRKAEEDLAAVWKEIESRFEESTGKSLNNTIHNDFKFNRPPRRTPVWTESTTTSSPTEEKKEVAIQPDNISILPFTDSTQLKPGKPTIPQPKQKAKTVGTPNPDMVAASIEKMHVEEPRLTIQISQRSMKVVDAMFYVPGKSNHPGEVHLRDFLRFMLDAGFAIERGWGSEWFFKPVKFGPAPNITIHDDHSSKLPLFIGRDIAKRLGEKYGWTHETFVVGK